MKSISKLKILLVGILNFILAIAVMVGGHGLERLDIVPLQGIGFIATGAILMAFTLLAILLLKPNDHEIAGSFGFDFGLLMAGLAISGLLDLTGLIQPLSAPLVVRIIITSGASLLSAAMLYLSFSSPKR